MHFYTVVFALKKTALLVEILANKISPCAAVPALYVIACETALMIPGRGWGEKNAERETVLSRLSSLADFGRVYQGFRNLLTTMKFFFHFFQGVKLYLWHALAQP